VNNYNIQLIETTFKGDGIKCLEYGLFVSNGQLFSRVPAISKNKAFVLNLLELCRKYKVSPIHIKDVVEDHLSLS
jgi:hypothetical protein